MLSKKLSLYTSTLALLLCQNLFAQAGTDSLVTLKSALLIAEQRYHLLKAHLYEVEAARKNIDVVKYIKFPTIDASYQANEATANNLTGMFYPIGILPITGPPSLKNSYTPVSGSAASILLNWQALTFGGQAAQINVSIAEANAKKLGLEQELFQHRINVISKYLDVLLAFDKVRLYEQNIQRAQVNLNQSRILASTGIRPGVDSALFLSELSKAKVTWIGARQQLETEQWLLAQLMAIDILPTPTDTSFLTKLPPENIPNDTSFRIHPIIQYAQSQLAVSQSKEQLLRKSYLPKLTVFGVAFSRGSGFQSTGTDNKTLQGLGFSRYNYGAGLQLAFPIMKYGEAKRQLQVQNLLSQAAQETVLQDNSELLTQEHIAHTTFDKSVAVVGESQQQLKSAQYAYHAMQIRYNTGLTNLSDVVQVQYNLLEAELGLKTAHWDAWKALLLQAAVKGDVNFFLNEIR